MKKYIYLVAAVALIFVGYYVVNAIFTPDYEIPVAKVDVGEFVIALNTSGTVDAKRAYTLSAPRMRGLQITWMAPEGSTVKEGDPVIKFDASQQMADLADQESELKIKQAALERARKEYTIQEKQLTLDLEKARRNFLEKQHEAPRIAEEAKLEKELAELNFEAKLEQLKADVDKAEVEVQRATDRRNQSQRELDQMTVNAPIPGLVVYLEIWKGSGMSKVQEGDSPWPGMGLIKLPDLGEMIVKTTVSEVDASKVDSAQEVIITVDAFPDHTYQGMVANKGALARKKDQNSDINVFDVEISILEHDDNLKPGMSASSRIVIDRLEDVVSVPMEAVFERDGQTVVYLKNKDKRDVEVGRRNDTAVQILSGLEGDEEVCLVDPTLDEQGLPGDKATEPELNQGRKQPPPGSNSGGGSGRRRGR